jgi:hypothetical protein
MSGGKKSRGILSLSELGYHVRDERIRRGFSLEQLVESANEMDSSQGSLMRAISIE